MVSIAAIGDDWRLSYCLHTFISFWMLWNQKSWLESWWTWNSKEYYWINRSDHFLGMIVPAVYGNLGYGNCDCVSLQYSKNKTGNGDFLKWGVLYPQIIHVSGIFPYKRFILGTTIWFPFHWGFHIPALIVNQLGFQLAPLPWFTHQLSHGPWPVTHRLCYCYMPCHLIKLPSPLQKRIYLPTFLPIPIYPWSI